VTRLRQMISARGLGTGDHLPPERELAREFRVSRPSLREALLSLEFLGDIEIRQRQGVFVRVPETDAAGGDKAAASANMSLAYELIESRAILEANGAILAATRADDEDIARLQREIDLFDSRGQSHDAMIRDAAFHHALALASHNRAQVYLVDATFDSLAQLHFARSGPISASADLWRETQQRIHSEHKEIVEAIKARSPERAEEAVRRHIESMETFLANVSGEPAANPTARPCDVP
jgi:GntR family transcriptional repressor for pyruvate dehydrogenase complex